MSRRRRTPEERQEAVQAWRRSGMSQLAFAKVAGFSKESLRRWIREFPRRDADAVDVEFVEVARVTAAPLVVVLPSGLRVEVAQGFDAVEVRRLVAALC